MQKQFSVSRNTVRQALRESQEQGYGYTQQGVGTRVRAAPPAFRFVHGSGSIEDLLQFSRATRMQLLARKQVVLDQPMADKLQGDNGESWLQLSLLRYRHSETQPIGFLYIFLRPEFAGIVPLIDASAQAVFSLVEQHYGAMVAEMEQEITSVVGTPEIAQLLDSDPAGHGLEVTRRYRDERGRLAQVSIGFYPAGRFIHHTRCRCSGGRCKAAGFEAVPIGSPTILWHWAFRSHEGKSPSERSVGVFQRSRRVQVRSGAGQAADQRQQGVQSAGGGDQDRSADTHH